MSVSDTAPSDVRSRWVARAMKLRERDFTEAVVLRVLCCSWNVNSKPPKDDLSAWIQVHENGADIVHVGLQEVDMSSKALLLNDDSRSAPWEDAILSLLGKQYALILAKQLVGIFSMVFVKRELLPHVSDVRFDVQGCGLMGMMGNKGGVAIAFNVFDTSFCFVDSHLAARLDEVSRRNQDYHDLIKRFLFLTSGECPDLDDFRELFDYERIFWVGDLNYRISLPDAECRSLVASGNMAKLLAKDQLLEQKAAGRAFTHFIEPEIAFLPTYRYDPGTDRWDTSEKKRSPAWCDRIQYRGEGISCVSYGRHELKQSDHRPVSALFATEARKVIEAKQREVYSHVLSQLDKYENSSRPDAAVSRNLVTFTDVMFGCAQSAAITLSNTGQVFADFEFKPKSGETLVSQPWLNMRPHKGTLAPGETIELHFVVNVTPAAAARLRGNDELSDIVVLHIANGRDIFVEVMGNYLQSCFGSSLDHLTRLAGSVRQDVLLEGMRRRVPRELWSMVQFLLHSGLDEHGLFVRSGNEEEMELVREYLDNGMQLDPDTCKVSVHSVCNCLLRFLTSLSEPVVPFSFYKAALAAADSASSCRQLVSRFPAAHRNTFYYIMEFVKELWIHAPSNGLRKEDISLVFSTAMLRSPYVASRVDDTGAARRQLFISQFT